MEHTNEYDCRVTYILPDGFRYNYDFVVYVSKEEMARNAEAWFKGDASFASYGMRHNDGSAHGGKVVSAFIYRVNDERDRILEIDFS